MPLEQMSYKYKDSGNIPGSLLAVAVGLAANFTSQVPVDGIPELLTRLLEVDLELGE